MSPNTIRNYRTTFAKLQAYFASHPEPGKTGEGGRDAVHSQPAKCRSSILDVAAHGGRQPLPRADRI
jgi:hypothetical protein